MAKIRNKLLLYHSLNQFVDNGFEVIAIRLVAIGLYETFVATKCYLI